MANLVAIQLVSSPDITQNLEKIEHQLTQLKIKTDTLVVLPECFACFGASDKHLLDIAEQKGHGPIQDTLAKMAKRYQIWLIAGSMPIRADNPTKFTASCLCFNAQGELVSEYQKIHLFDVNVNDNTGQYMESRFTQPGKQVVILDNTPFGRVGIAICYDVRFPGLFQAMGQIDVVALPAAFTKTTGQAHWHNLLAARSIENQCYLVAANQGGTHKNGRQTYGHSCIYSPWGKLLAETELGEGHLRAQWDIELLNSIRQAMPIRQQNRFRSQIA